MPNVATITSSDFTSFQPSTKIKSAEVNSNFGVFRGHLLPVDPTISSATNLSYDLGATDRRWRFSYSSPVINLAETTGSMSIQSHTDIARISASGGTATATLPSLSSLPIGRLINIEKTDTSSSDVLISGNGSNIDGTTTAYLRTLNESVAIVRASSEFRIVRRNIPSKWVTFTPTGTWSTNTTYVGRWRRVGDSMEIQTQIQLSGAPTSTGLIVNLPSGYTIDTTKLVSASGAKSLGYGKILDSGSYNGVAAAYYNNTTSVEVRSLSTAVAYSMVAVTQSVPFTFANNDNIDLTYVVPIVGWGG